MPNYNNRLLRKSRELPVLRLLLYELGDQEHLRYTRKSNIPIFDSEVPYGSIGNTQEVKKAIQSIYYKSGFEGENHHLTNSLEVSFRAEDYSRLIPIVRQANLFAVQLCIYKLSDIIDAGVSDEVIGSNIRQNFIDSFTIFRGIGSGSFSGSLDYDLKFKITCRPDSSYLTGVPAFDHEFLKADEIKTKTDLIRHFFYLYRKYVDTSIGEVVFLDKVGGNKVFQIPSEGGFTNELKENDIPPRINIFLHEDRLHTPQSKYDAYSIGKIGTDEPIEKDEGTFRYWILEVMKAWGLEIAHGHINKSGTALVRTLIKRAANERSSLNVNGTKTNSKDVSQYRINNYSTPEGGIIKANVPQSDTFVHVNGAKTKKSIHSNNYTYWIVYPGHKFDDEIKEADKRVLSTYYYKAHDRTRFLPEYRIERLSWNVVKNRESLVIGKKTLPIITYENVGGKRVKRTQTNYHTVIATFRNKTLSLFIRDNYKVIRRVPVTTIGFTKIANALTAPSGALSNFTGSTIGNAEANRQLQNILNVSEVRGKGLNPKNLFLLVTPSKNKTGATVFTNTKDYPTTPHSGDVYSYSFNINAELSILNTYIVAGDMIKIRSGVNDPDLNKFGVLPELIEYLGGTDKDRKIESRLFFVNKVEYRYDGERPITTFEARSTHNIFENEGLQDFEISLDKTVGT